MILLLLAAVGFGIAMFVAPRDSVTDNGEPAATSHEEALTGRSAGQLQVAEYVFDPDLRQVSGSVMNGTDRHYVNIQVEFVLFDLEGDSAGVARDTTRELAAGETWRFNIFVEDPDVSDVEPGQVTAAERRIEGPQAVSPPRIRGPQPEASVDNEVEPEGR
ncbi:MAG: FxLYD domain-containing protein [Rhodothermales bacterium]